MWQVQLYGQIEQADLETLQLWLIDRRIKPSTLVRFGDQPWQAAENVPDLQEICATITREEQAVREKSARSQVMPGSAPRPAAPMPGSAVSTAPQVASRPSAEPIVTREGGAWTGFRYVIEAPGFEGRRIEVKGSTMFSFPKVLIDGQVAPRGAKRKRWMLRRNDGRDAEIELRSWGLDPVPRLFLDGAEIVLERPLTPMEWGWIGISLTLLIMGGGVGGFFGGVALMVNARIFRGMSSPVMRYLASGGVSAAAFLSYCVVVALLVGKTSSIRSNVTSPSIVQWRTVPIRPSEWKPLTLADNGATLLMPETVKDQPESIDFSGGKIQRHVYRSAINGDAQEFCLSFIDGINLQSVGNHHERPRDALCLLSSATLSQLNASLNFKNLSFERGPAIEFKGIKQGEDAQIFGRAYYIDNRFYLNTAVGKNHSLTEAQASEFLDSFSLR